MNLELHDRTALILGGGGGLGSAIAEALAAEGASVAVADIAAAAAEETAARLREAGGRTTAVEWDLADLSSVPDRLSAVESRLGKVDILVSLTGGPPPTPAAGQPPEVWISYFQSMVASVIAIADAVLPAMRAQRWGRIITSTSSGIVMPIPNLGISNALRLSLLGWSKTLAAEVGRDGITCNVVIPGRIATKRIRFLDEQKAKRESRGVEEIARQSEASIPLGRYGEPAEYADVVAFLASSRASYVTGSAIRVDGGLIGSV